MNRLLEHIALRSDTTRALRASMAFGAPLLACHAMGLPQQAVFIAIGAQTIALPDLRGAYGMRLVILLTMILVVASAGLLGVWAGSHLVTATLGMGFLALLSGYLRHLSADYGPGLSVGSALLFLLGTSQPGPLSAGLHLAGLISLGGVGAAFLHMASWPFRPQHPLRYAVAETWVAASDMAACMRPGAGTAAAARHEEIATAERELRVTLDRTFVILSAAASRRPSPFLTHMEDMRRQAVHFSMRLIAFQSSLEPLMQHADFRRHQPVVDSVLKALGDAARSVAITLITHRAENFTATDIRLQRGQHLICVLEEQLTKTAPDPISGAQSRAALGQISQALLQLRDALEQTVDHGDVRFRFSGKLPDISSRSVQSLAAWVNRSPDLDPVLVRYSLRMAVLTMLTTAIYKGFGIPHGYWIPFTIVVVLQPDYGATRQRAAQRIGGTLAGSILGSGLLWIKMPLFWLDGFATAMGFGFAYFLKRRYGVAVFFVTLMLVLITETVMTVNLDFTFMRLVSNLIGGSIALIASILIWPSWEGPKFSALLVSAVQANTAYLSCILDFMRAAPTARPDLLMAKRRAENADRHAAASLQRLLAEPGARHASAAALVTYNQRITRAFTAISVHLADLLQEDRPLIEKTMQEIMAVLELLTGMLDRNETGNAIAPLLQRISDLAPSFGAGHPTSPHPLSTAELIDAHLTKSVAEIHAMALALG